MDGRLDPGDIRIGSEFQQGGNQRPALGVSLTAWAQGGQERTAGSSPSRFRLAPSPPGRPDGQTAAGHGRFFPWPARARAVQ